ncbi:Crp/Fnr family transcriptional regulator [Anaerosacchariphilus polymeriproducens]|uniref:Crp/Fnr family transcriptional regulator n=1 Tax=Anaerosacchariphilus polymeriproducens TaxID=1812858 RepID=A0A371AY64_9FIRM|nr:Crp/Fnr family transcriptional regulator [Anaerosacchariphilus polymeriproducens]RDU24525.1 Crp/Fnr family transcriptional regulator [Anaerosacchariphilus polymeriproducens]
MMDNMDIILDTLSVCPIFFGLNRESISTILEQIEYKTKRYEKNDIVYHANEYSLYMCIIISGYVEVKKILTSGNTVSVFHRNKGELFGGAIVFSSVSSYPYDVIAKEKSEILFIHKYSILESLCKEPLIVSNILNLFSNRVLEYEKRLELYSYSSIMKKIAFSLLYEFTIKNDTVILPFSKKTWAEHLNVSRPSLCRELKILCDKNILKVNDRTIIIIKKDVLENLL